MKKTRKVDKDGNEDIMIFFCKLEFFDSGRFMAHSLSNLVDNFAEGIHKTKRKDCHCFLEYKSVNESLK